MTYGEPAGSSESATATYHNLYAIIIVVIAFVAMESVKLAAAREKARLLSK